MSRSSSKHMSARLARMWNSKSPGVATAVCAGPRISANGRSWAGRRGCPNRSQAALPIATLHDSRPCKSRNPTVRSSPPISAITPRTLRTASAVPPIDTTRNIAARDSGAKMLCGSIGTRSEESTIGNDSPQDLPREDLSRGILRYLGWGPQPFWPSRARQTSQIDESMSSRLFPRRQRLRRPATA